MFLRSFRVAVLFFPPFCVNLVPLGCFAVGVGESFLPVPPPPLPLAFPSSQKDQGRKSCHYNLTIYCVLIFFYFLLLL